MLEDAVEAVGAGLRDQEAKALGDTTRHRAGEGRSSAGDHGGIAKSLVEQSDPLGVGAGAQILLIQLQDVEGDKTLTLLVGQPLTVEGDRAAQRV